MSTPKIVVYSSRFCPYCDAAERMLQTKKVKYEVIKVDEEPDQFQHMVKISGRRSVPQIFIDDFHVGGFDDMAALNTQGKLDKLLKL